MIKELKFNKTITSLAGNKYGQKVFEEQVKNVSCDEKYTIIFPNQIEDIATSFIQGFFQQFVMEMGIYGIEKNVQIESSIKNLKQLIMDCLA